MRVTRYAQSTVLIESNGSSLLIDPGSYNFEPDRVTRSFFSGISVLIVTHKHADHFDLEAVRAIHAQSGAVVLSVPEVAATIVAEGMPAQVIGVGESVLHAGFRIDAVRADHVVRDEIVDVFGVIVEAEGKRVYHASDTTYFEPIFSRIDLAFVPINNRGVAMNFDDAARFVRELAPKIVVPVHYDSPKDSHIDPTAWAALLRDDSAIDVKVMRFGETIRL